MCMTKKITLWKLRIFMSLLILNLSFSDNILQADNYILQAKENNQRACKYFYNLYFIFLSKIRNYGPQKTSCFN